MRAEAFITLELPRAARARRTTTLTPAEDVRAAV
jgi:lysyl-tRNA synthetase class 2